MYTVLALHGSGVAQNDMQTTQVLRGTCQDMCPEKERYVREDRRRLSVYEIVPGTDGVSYSSPTNESKVMAVLVG